MKVYAAIAILAGSILGLLGLQRRRPLKPGEVACAMLAVAAAAFGLLPPAVASSTRALIVAAISAILASFLAGQHHRAHGHARARLAELVLLGTAAACGIGARLGLHG